MIVVNILLLGPALGLANLNNSAVGESGSWRKP